MHNFIFAIIFLSVLNYLKETIAGLPCLSEMFAFYIPCRDLLLQSVRNRMECLKKKRSHGSFDFVCGLKLHFLCEYKVNLKI